MGRVRDRPNNAKENLMIGFDGRDMLVRPPYSQSQEVKKDLGGRWDKDEQAWKLPPTSMNVLRLMELYGDDALSGAPDVIRDLAEQPWGFRGFTPDEAR